MKYQKILGLVATAGLLLAGCATDSDNNNTWLSDPNAVHVSASVGSIFTRSNPAASDETGQKGFNKDDVMGVSNSGKSINYTYNGTDWQPGDGSYLVWNDNLNFECWYPADGKNTFSKGYIQEDQSNATEIAKSDYMTAAVTNLTEIPGNRQLEVALVRKTARLILNIQSFNDQFTADPKVDHVRIVGKECTDANETSTINIKPLQNGEGGIGTTYTALVAPGAVEGHLYFAAEGTTETPLVVKTAALEAGKSYTYNLIVGKNKVTIGDVTVAEWGEDKIEGGKAEFTIPYVTFTAEKPQTFKMTEINGYTISDLEYSVNGGEWKNVVADTGVDFGGDKGNLRLRGTNTNGTASADDPCSTIKFTNDNVKVACKGDIRTLLDWKNYSTVETQNARFCNLFEGCSVLTSAPELPATTLAESCYSVMFSGCTSLTSAPKLPATTLALGCYSSMFNGCTSLTSAPTLPATTLADYCYTGMFIRCTSLTSAPTLSATTLEEGCYQSMFVGCSNLQEAPELPATTLAKSCYSEMFYDCTSLTSAPELKATTLADHCYSAMFYGCTNMTSVTMLASKDYFISSSFNNWLFNAGTDPNFTRTLKVQDKAAYDELKNYLPTEWQIGFNCTVFDNAGNAITEQ